MHSERCWRGLVSVFNPQKRPWINPPEGAETEAIINQIQQCPSVRFFFLLQ
ncbi:MAG: (4Fe-4S)-binding protein [Bacteroidia bacterium]